MIATVIAVVAGFYGGLFLFLTHFYRTRDGVLDSKVRIRSAAWFLIGVSVSIAIMKISN